MTLEIHNFFGQFRGISAYSAENVTKYDNMKFSQYKSVLRNRKNEYYLSVRDFGEQGSGSSPVEVCIPAADADLGNKLRGRFAAGRAGAETVRRLIFDAGCDIFLTFGRAHTRKFER